MSTVIQLPAPVSLKQHLSREVRALMARNDVNQTELAKRLGIDQSSVSAKLNNRTEWKLDEVETISRLFGVTPAELMGGYSSRPGPGGGNQVTREKLRVTPITLTHPTRRVGANLPHHVQQAA